MTWVIFAGCCLYYHELQCHGCTGGQNIPGWRSLDGDGEVISMVTAFVVNDGSEDYVMTDAYFYDIRRGALCSG